MQLHGNIEGNITTYYRPAPGLFNSLLVLTRPVPTTPILSVKAKVSPS